MVEALITEEDLQKEYKNSKIIAIFGIFVLVIGFILIPCTGLSIGVLISVASCIAIGFLAIVITIPKDFRDKLKLHEGDEVILYIQDDGIIIKPKTAHLGMLRGLLREEIALDKAMHFIKAERTKWRL